MVYIAEHQNYFGIDDDAAVETGIAAKEFTLSLLKRSPFTVATKWERVFNSERFYAFITPEALEGGESYLCERLINQGLARIHTKGVDLPSGESWRSFRDKLRKDEKSAQSSDVGGWRK